MIYLERIVFNRVLDAMFQTNTFLYMTRIRCSGQLRHAFTPTGTCWNIVLHSGQALTINWGLSNVMTILFN